MQRKDERSVSDVLQDIFGNLQDIVRSEVRLAQAEIKTETRKAATAAKSLVIGIVLAMYAGALLLLALVYGLTLFLPAWQSALALGALLAVIAAVAIGMGRERMRMVNPKLPRTAGTLKEDIRWLSDQTR